MKTWLKRFLPLIILGLGVLITSLLVMGRPEAKRKPKAEAQLPLVRVLELNPQARQLEIAAFATTEPARQVAVSPQVGGRVVWISEKMVEGELVKEQELLFQLDPADYQLAVEQAKAGEAKAEYDLDMALAQQETAKKGLKAYQSVQKSPSKLSGLALFEPQVKNAKASLVSAQAGLEQALLRLERTEIKAPFTGYFRSVSVALGQNLAANQAAAQLFSDMPILLKVSLPLADLPLIEVGEKGAEVVLKKTIGAKLHRWKGRAVRRLQEIDSLGRMAQVMVEVADPVSDQGFSLPLGLQVEVNFAGARLGRVFELPISAVHQGDQVWLIGADGRLEIRPLSILRRQADMALVEEGLEPGERLVTSSLLSPIPGMALKVFTESLAGSEPATDPANPVPKAP